nr:immunoglobulin heavy chain junction region [Macaca mulatta]MOX58900.1 immunoglobulin heavy chain junction region [Macaca mulatta]MOX58962.1 immunoglobulin heavy chain junction region [Macaca mulatta]MOX59049.1 immunoglobulin heavy chain junction region [Macaca mulatta]MOX59173.1 immunoglobulin heavy chain junction region [Macaca mulatta]
CARRPWNADYFDYW